MSRYLAQMTVSTAEVERAAVGGLDLPAAIERRTRREAGTYGEPAREAPWVPDSRPPWWARGLTCFAEVER